MIDAWYGSERSYREVERLLNSFEMSSSKPQLSNLDELGPNPINTTITNGLGVMTVKGSIVSTSTWLTRWLGIPSYEDIREAVAGLAGNPDVKAIVINYDTPGGAAKGCKSCANYIREVDTKYKPVVSYTNESACSAGFWLFSAGSQRVVGEDAQIGSVGAIIVHTEYSEMDKNMGITRTVKRSAPYKALGTPFEKLSEEAEKELDDELEYLHNLFVTGIADLTRIPERKVRDTIATGRVFRTEEALRLKMADTTLSFGDTLARIAKRINRKPSASK